MFRYKRVIGDKVKHRNWTLKNSTNRNQNRSRGSADLRISVWNVFNGQMIHIYGKTSNKSLRFPVLNTATFNSFIVLVKLQEEYISKTCQN